MVMRHLSTLVVVLLLLSCKDGAPGPAGPQGPGLEPGFVSVRNAPYSARGDGVTDDGPAIQQALDDVGAAGGGRVYLPTGNYRVAGHLNVPSNTSLSGVFSAPPKRPLLGGGVMATKAVQGTTLFAEENANNPTGSPFIVIRGYSVTIEGISIYYPNQTETNPPISYPFTIGLRPPVSGQVELNENATIQNVLLWNSYDGIDLASAPSSRHLVRNVYGFPLHTGIAVDKAYDVGRIENVHFNHVWTHAQPIVDYTQANGTAFAFYRTDGEQVRNVFVHGYKVGMRFSKAPAPDPFDNNSQLTPDAYMDTINLEQVEVGIDLYDTKTQGVIVSNYMYDVAPGLPSSTAAWSHAGTMGTLTIHGGLFWGVPQRILLWEGLWWASVSDTKLQMGNANGSGIPAFDIRSGTAMISHNLFFPVSCTNPAPAPPACPGALRGVYVGPGADQATIVGNIMNGSSLEPSANTTSASNRP